MVEGVDIWMIPTGTTTSTVDLTTTGPTTVHIGPMDICQTFVMCLTTIQPTIDPSIPLAITQVFTTDMTPPHTTLTPHTAVTIGPATTTTPRPRITPPAMAIIIKLNCKQKHEKLPTRFA